VTRDTAKSTTRRLRRWRHGPRFMVGRADRLGHLVQAFDRRGHDLVGDIALTATPGLSMWPSLAVSAGSSARRLVRRPRRQPGDLLQAFDRRWQHLGEDVRLTSASFYSEYPVTAASGQLVHVAWSDNRDGNYEAYYNARPTAARRWLPDVRLSNASGSSTAMSLAAAGNRAPPVLDRQP